VVLNPEVQACRYTNIVDTETVRFPCCRVEAVSNKL
jgi:hypothetical protein